MIRKLSNNKELEDMYVKEHEEIKDYLSKSKIRNCISCFSTNCIEKSNVAKGLGLEYKPRKDCKRKEGWLKFGKVKDSLKLPSEMSRKPFKPKAATKHTTVSV